MTTKQRMSILLERWPAACEAQGWNKNDREKRLDEISKAIGRDIQSMNDLNNGSDIDAVYAHLGRLADNVARTVETLPAKTVHVSAGDWGRRTKGRTVVVKDTPGYRRRIIWLVRRHSQQLGGLVYALQLARDKFGITTGVSTIEDLTTEQIHGLMITLAARAHARAREEEEIGRAIGDAARVQTKELITASEDPF